ncbi:MAG: putative regulatory lipoprotein [Verrucomicrobiaceae bacterium]|nr:putative regulatory lipoprotein [Verrucomicrobiaceae bacterium]
MTNSKSTVFALNRRNFLKGSAVALATVALPLRADPRNVVVVTSYPDEVVSRFEAAFEKLHPEYRLQIIWRMPRDALPYLLQPQQSGVDVYWSASPRTFARLKSENALRKLDIDRTKLPTKIGHTQLRDADDYFVATEMAGYGFAINESALTRLGVRQPKDWRDLTDPRLAGQIALPNPARVGFAPVMIDIVLQGYGWQQGWALWNEIAAQSVLMEHGASFVSDDVASGRCAVGLSIDFFVASAIANGAKLKFAYPHRSGINPGHIAITASASNGDGARAFAEFVLSQAGQLLLTHPDIRKLPVLPAAYTQLDADYYRPFDAAARGELDYDNDVGRNRLGVIAAYFDQHLAYRHDEQAALWKQLHAQEKLGRTMTSARAILSAAPLREEQAASAELQKIFRERIEGAEPTLSDIERTWRSETDNRVTQAKALLENTAV